MIRVDPEAWDIMSKVKGFVCVLAAGLGLPRLLGAETSMSPLLPEKGSCATGQPADA